VLQQQTAVWSVNEQILNGTSAQLGHRYTLEIMRQKTNQKQTLEN